MELGVLGPVEAVEDGRRFPLGGPKQRTVLALLIANAGRSVSTGSLIDGVYGDDPPTGARRSIQTYVSNLRGELGDIIASTNDGYELAVERSVVDALRFEDGVSAAKDRDPVEASALLREVLNLWRGHPYADVDGGHSLDAEIRRLDEMRMQALEARIDADLAAGYHRDLVAEIESLTVEYPLRERFCEQQMVALYRSGRQAEALRAYERTRTYLVNEMGLDPSARLRDLERRILDQDATLDLEAAPSIKRAAVMVTDIADPASLSRISADEHTALIDGQTVAIESAAARHGGEVFATSGTAVYMLFPDASSAASAASDIQHQLDGTEPEGHRLRVAIDVGDVETGDTVTGPPVNRSAAIVSAGHGGQVLLSWAAQQEITETSGGGWVVRGLGSQDLRGLESPEIVHQLVIDGLPDRFPDLRIQAVPTSLPMAPRGLAGYELREEVGSGAFGVVHRAYQPSVGREVAVKIVRPEWANLPEFVRRFEIEAQLVARLEHPHIVPLYDYWREPDGAYLVMRWLRGGTLGNRIASHHLSIDEAHALLTDIGPALAFAHRQGVVHHDIKPSNVLLDDEGSAYLSDFGIAGDTPLRGVGSVADDVRALAGMLRLCIGASSEPAVADLLTRATSDDGGFGDVRSFIAAWEDAVGAGDATSKVVGYTPTRNPYKGLSAFGELDAADFHGRDDVVGQLLAAVDEHDLVVAVGPSGIGKSSVIKAGLIPALRGGAIEGSDEWLITTMVPGAFPFDELAAALLRVAVKAPSDLEDVLRKDARGLGRVVARYLPPDETVVLVVDQFEELFTLCNDEDLRTGFLDTLVAAAQDPRSRIKLVLTIRADFFDRPLAYGEFGTLIQEATVPITSPTEAQLNEIVCAPAEGVGVGFEPGLPERLVGAVKDQPGGLPLLEFSLTELFEGRDSDVLTKEAYEATGGVKAALGRRAEGIYNGSEVSQQDTCRDIFLRMVTVNESGRDTRRRVRLSEIKRLGYDPRSVDEILSAFSAHRLLTFDRDPITRGPTVEVAHEAILTEWPRLAGWIEDHREDLLLRSRLAVAVADWEASDRPETYLLTGGRLDQHEAWTTDTDLTLTTAEQEFLTASRTTEDERRAKRRRTRRLVMSGFGIAAVIALVLAIAALIARDDAQEQAAQAHDSQQEALASEVLAEQKAAEAEANATAAASEREIAASRALAAAAVGALDEDPELSLLLSLQASRAAPLDFEGRQALRASISQHKTIWSFPWTRSFMWMVWPATSPDGRLIAVNGSYEDIEVWDISGTDPALLWNLELDPGYANITSFTDDGAQLAVSIWWQGWANTALPPDPPDPSLTEGLHFYDARTGEPVRQFVASDSRCAAERGPEQRYNDLLRIDVDGAWIGRGTCTDLEGEFWWLIDHATGEMIGDPVPIDADVIELNITRNGWLFEVYADEMTLTNVYTGAERIVPIADMSWPYVSPDGSYAMTTEEIIDTETGIVRWRFADNGLDLDEWIPPCFPEQTNDAETIIYVTCNDGTASVHDAYTGRLITSLSGHTGWVSSSSNAAGDLLVTGSADRTTRVWDIDRPRGQTSFRLENGYHADSSLQVVGDRATVLVYPDEVSSPFDGAISVMNRVSPANAVVFTLGSGDELARFANAGGKVARLSPDGTRLAVQAISDSGVGLGSVWVHGVDASSPTTEMQGNCEWEPTGFFFDGGDSEECPFDGDPFAADVTDLSWSPDGELLAAAAGRSQRVVVWDAASGKTVFVTDRLGIWPFSSIQFSPDGSLLAASSKTGMWVFDTSDWSEVAMVTHPGRPSWAMRFTPDGSEIITAQAHRGVLRIYDTTTWKERDISVGRGQSRDLAISESGRLVALANNIGLVHVIDIEAEEVIETYPLPGTDITNVEFINGDRELLVTDAFGPVDVLTLDTDELIEEARTRLSRSFTEAECSTYDIDPCPTLAEIRSG